MLLGRKFDFLGYLVVTVRYLVVTARYLMVTRGYPRYRSILLVPTFSMNGNINIIKIFVIIRILRLCKH